MIRIALAIRDHVPFMVVLICLSMCLLVGGGERSHILQLVLSHKAFRALQVPLFMGMERL